MSFQFCTKIILFLTQVILSTTILCTQVLASSNKTNSTINTETNTTNKTVSFYDWKKALRSEALAKGIDGAIFDQALKNINLNPHVVKADHSQPEFIRPIWDYLDGSMAPLRITRGRALLYQKRYDLERIELKYGVNKEILVAIWGIESNFGSNIGHNNVIRSLATLAFQSRRQDFWRKQLLAALEIMQAGEVKPNQMVGSWAGAIGQTQFMPTTYNEHAVDFDGDGKRNLWDSSTDALASAAHYLNKSGWKKNQPWGYEVILPKSFDYALATPNKKLTLKQWALMGVIPTYKQKKLPSETLASILLPAGYRGPSFIVFNNFSTLLKYNNSTSYALSVGLLSQRLALKPGIKAKWPKDTHQLNRKERVELQQKLSQCCHDVGTVDGVIGANTRKAIRSFQKGQGVPVDGYADYALLELLRNPIKTPSMKR